MHRFKAVCVSLLLASWPAPAQPSVVVTAQGAVRGDQHRGYTSYLGIPYASVTEAGRFKRAGLAPTWSGVRESQQFHCSVSSRAEDCLTLDVHVPAAGARLPVLAWARGGGAHYRPGKLVAQGIAVVVISHRLGPLGFLCHEDERIPGNAGVKDVVVALRWVRDNISAFNGDPNKVVLGGQGLGAAMAEALVLTHAARGLFHGAVLHSGSALCPWAFNYDAAERALMLAQLLDDSGDETATLVNSSVAALADKSDTMGVPYFSLGMCVEQSFRHEERLLAEPPRRLLQDRFARSVPLIIGYNSDEAYVFLSLLRRPGLHRRMARDMSMLLPEELKFANEDELRNAVKQIRDSYFKNNNYSIEALLDYHRDAYFASHILRSARLHAASPLPVYLYRFSHSGAAGVTVDHQVPKRGAAHSDELAYLFPETDGDMEGADGVVQQHLIRLWSNFVKYLEPNPSGDSGPRWEPVDGGDPRLLDISEELVMREAPAGVRVWDDIYERFYYAKGPGGS